MCTVQTLTLVRNVSISESVNQRMTLKIIRIVGYIVWFDASLAYLVQFSSRI